MILRKRINVLALMSLVLLLSGTAFAAEEPAVHKKSMMELFEATGMVGYLMVACSIVGTTLVIEHIINLRRYKLAPDDLGEELQALIEEEAYDDAMELCEERPTYLTNLVGAALTMRHAGYEEMIGGLESAAAEEALKLNTHISYLSLIGNVAPLLGLLGTVTGMITAFQRIETLKAPTPGDLAVGVYESLVNTTMGLFIALVFLTAYFVFKNNVSKMALSINLQAVEMLKHLAGRKHSVAA
ncbi:MAG TPA: MotA/TolQ/ExbB proton channel family protein [Planctomycetota bacterium]|nr:MotA/TolQ/ExbB proton channel family protein [Planctomycetota bacterium]